MSTSVGAAAAITKEAPPATPALLSAMLRVATKISDLIFSPGRPPIVEQNGSLLAVRVQGLPLLTADHTQRIAADLIGNNKHALDTLREQGACDTLMVCRAMPVLGSTFSCSGAVAPS